MITTDFTTTFAVDQTPEAVFNAINNVRGWWSEEIDGGTEKLNDVFNYRFKDVHICKIKLVEVVPAQKIVWHVLENHFSFTKDKKEWTDTKIVFEISRKNNKTEVRFTHIGLVPEYECFEVCQDAWTNYIQTSLRDLIVKGKGQPNPKEGGFNQQIVDEYKLGNDLHVQITVKATPHEAFKAINNVTGWWTENLKGNSQKTNDEFSVQFGDIHYSKQKLAEVIPDQKVVWLVTESKLNFIKDKQEWDNTKIVFEISSQNGKTIVDFTHVGLVPQIECYDTCSGVWREYVEGSLKSLIETGKGQPTAKE